MEKAVIVSAVRTPLGNFGGTLGNIGATDLGEIGRASCRERVCHRV